MTRDMTAVRQEVNDSDSSVLVQELELAMNLALNGLLLSLGKTYAKQSEPSIHISTYLLCQSIFAC